MVDQYQSQSSIDALNQALPGGSDALFNLAYTLAMHRSHLQWRSFALLQSPEDLHQLSEVISMPAKAQTDPPRIGFVFSGQGAQWYAMGRELLAYSSFSEELECAAKYLETLGCSWSVTDELLKSEAASCSGQPAASLWCYPSATVGHSSGEIAAAYAAGHLSRESSWKVAYYRGLCSAEVASPGYPGPSGAMISIGLSEASAREVVERLDRQSTAFGISVACINSPSNVTVSGEAGLIDQLKTEMDSRHVFARKLRVNTAYHSRQMKSISSKYISLMGSLTGPADKKPIVPMVSSVTGRVAHADELLDPAYWALNMISPVQFDQAVSTMCAKSPAEYVKKIDRSHHKIPIVNHLVEIGPHAALRGPLRDILRASSRGSSIAYTSILQRGQSAVDTTLSAMGELHCLGQALEFEAINQPSGEPKHKPSLLVNLPEYPFDHSQHYWHESRLSRAYRLRPDAPSELLGTRSRDWNPSDARWSHFIKTVEMPWTEHHVVNGETLYPGAGMVVMAIEAAKQLNRDANIDGFTLKGVRIEAAMDLSASKGICEVQTSLRQLSGLTYEFVVKTYVDDNWTDNCRGTITVALAPDSPEEDWDGSRKASEKQRIVTDLCDSIAACQQPVDHHNMYGFLKRTGYEFGPLFQGARNQRCNGALKQAAADVKLYSSSEEPHVVHPVSLDAIFHLCFTSFTAGGTRPMATSVPSGIGTLWVANTGLARPAQESVACLSKITKTTNRGFLASGGAMSSGPEKNLLVWMDGLELTNISAAPRPLEAPNPQQFCMNVEQKLALDKMDPHDLQAYLDATHPVEEDLTSFFQDMAHLIKMALERMLESVDYSQIDGQEAWKQRYWEWAQHHLTEGRLKDLPTTTAESFDQLCSRLGGITNVGPLYATVASNLSALMKGETDSLDLLMHSGLLKKYYEDLAGYRCTTQAVTYIDLLAHQKPGLTILEVGGGTGSTTRAVVSALAATGNTAGKTLRCNRYDFTDVSASFLEKARSEFAAYESQMTFGTLNIEQDFAEQGYEEGAYDVVVADAVLHITADLGQTFRNVRKALKPGGKLIMPELLHPDGWTAGFVFGLFPGWWLASREEGPLSPNLSAEGWGAVLKANGFSGSDLVFTDFDGPAHHLGCVISTAVLPPELRNGHLKPQKQGADIIIQTDCPQQREFAERLLPSLDAFFSPHEGRSELSVVLVDYVASFVASLDAHKFAQLQKFVGISRRVLWISTGGGRAPTPDYALLNGLSRTLRTEFYELHLVTLALEETTTATSDEPNKTGHVEQVVSEMLARRPGQYYEQHYVEIDGHLHTERLVEADYLKTDMDDQLRPYKVVPSAIGRLLQAQDQLAVRGYEPEPIFGNYFSGVALNVGDRTGAIHPGDRVFAAHPGSFRSEVRTASQAAVRIPEHLPFSDACWLLPPLVVAYNLLVEVSRVRKGDSVLIHHGSRLLGQAAVGLLADQGVQDVWITSSSEKEHAWILENLGIPEEHVLPGSWFDSGVMLVSHLRRKFDIVLWSHDHSKPPLSTDYVREGGRYILVDNGLSSSSTTPLTMQPASTNIAVYLYRSANHIPTQEALQYAAVYPHENLLRNSHNDVSKFCASDLLGFTRHLQHAHRDETTVVSLENTAAVIDVRIPNHDSYSLDANATYVVAGGLGGLGSAMARWLVHRGARNLVLLSRSGPRTAEARKMLEEFAVQGVHYETPACSIVDRDALRQTLSDCATRLPPIKGCIQSSMVMTEKVFQNMDFADWQNTIDPKVAGSWNLHAELPRGLDFFVLISSMMGILGSGSLAAYNAGNTYMDGLARFRLAQGERAVSIDLGAVPDGGYLVSNSEHAAGRQHVLQADKYALTPVRELCALLDVFCRPPAEEGQEQEQTAAGLRCHGGQAIVGIRPPSHWKHAEEVPPTLNQPFWGHMHHVPLPAGLEGGAGENGRKKRQTLNVVERLAAARSDNEAEEVVGEALAQRLSGLLGVAEDRLDPHKPMHSYGLDSLSAIELRSWIGQTFQVDFPVFVILGSATFTNSAKTIVSKMKSA
ncbi:polyketide synthase [Apiospora arundinis]